VRFGLFSNIRGKKPRSSCETCVCAIRLRDGAKTLKLRPTVAVIDTGVDLDKVGRHRITPGVNFSLDGDGDDTHDPHGHGTAITATILDRSAAIVLPVKLICETGYLRAEDQLEVAFAWIIANCATRSIDVVCASFADASHDTSDERYRGSGLHRHIAALRASGIAVVAPAGNRYAHHRHRGPQGMGWPAILREVVSVGELLPGGATLSSDTQRLHVSMGTGCQTTIFAFPGAPGGTSGAAAVVAARLADLRAAHPKAQVEALLNLLRQDAPTARDESGLLWPALRPAPASGTSR
jgi:subtilisin family serine protease